MSVIIGSVKEEGKTQEMTLPKKEFSLGIKHDADNEEYDGTYSDSGDDSESDQAQTTNCEEFVEEEENIVPEDASTGDISKKLGDKKGNEKKAKGLVKKTIVTKQVTKRKPYKLLMNVADTQYPVVRFVGKKLFKWKLCYDVENMDCDLVWTDNAVQPEQLGKMQPHQKINHFPGMFVLARKNHLARNLKKMKKQFPDLYKFFPQTWLLPAEYNELRVEFEKTSKGKCKTFIVKPEASCQGRGIFLTRNLDDLTSSDHYVVQRYLAKPYLLDGLKFDFRIYVLLAGCDPMRIYVFKEGLARLATEEYEAPHRDNLDNLCMHLTNYAINKDNPNFEFNEDEHNMDVGHKRSMTSVMDLLASQGHDIQKLWDQIKEILIKTIVSAQPTLSHHYKSCQPDNYMNNMCFEILGFDVILDSHLRPWLLEINHTPSFTTDTPLDSLIKKNCIRDALVLMNINNKTRNEIINLRREQLQKRVLTGKKHKLTVEEKLNEIRKSQIKRNEYESKNLGNYEKVYPLETESEDPYIVLQQYSLQLYENWTGANIRRVSKKDQNSLGGTSALIGANNNSKNIGNQAQARGSLTEKLRNGLPSSKLPGKQSGLLKPTVTQSKTMMGKQNISPPNFSSQIKIRSDDNIDNVNFLQNDLLHHPNKTQLEGEDGQSKHIRNIKHQNNHKNINHNNINSASTDQGQAAVCTPSRIHNENDSGIFQKPPSPFTVQNNDLRKQHLAGHKAIANAVLIEEERQQMIKRYAQFAVDLNSQNPLKKQQRIYQWNVNKQPYIKISDNPGALNHLNISEQQPSSAYSYIRQASSSQNQTIQTQALQLQQQQQQQQIQLSYNNSSRQQFQQISNQQLQQAKMLPGLARNGLNNDELQSLAYQKRLQEANKFQKPLLNVVNNGLYLQPKLFDLNLLTKTSEEDPQRKDQQPIPRNKQVVYSSVSYIGNAFDLNSQKVIANAGNNNYLQRRK